MRTLGLKRNAGSNLGISEILRPTPVFRPGVGLICYTDFQVSARIPLPTPSGPPGGELPRRGKRGHPGVSPREKGFGSKPPNVSTIDSHLWGRWPSASAGRMRPDTHCEFAQVRRKMQPAAAPHPAPLGAALPKGEGIDDAGQSSHLVGVGSATRPTTLALSLKRMTLRIGGMLF